LEFIYKSIERINIETDVKEKEKNIQEIQEIQEIKKNNNFQL